MLLDLLEDSLAPDADESSVVAYESLKAALDPNVVGRIVRVFKATRGAKPRVPIGTQGKVVWVGFSTHQVGRHVKRTPRIGMEIDGGKIVFLPADNCEAVLP